MAKTFRKKKSAPTKERKSPKKEGSFGISAAQLELICGVFFLIISLVMLIAFVSYLFTGEADQDLVQKNFRTAIENSSKKAENSLGVLGAFISHYFIFKWFGYAAFGLIPIIFLSAFRLVFQQDLFEVNLNRFAKGSIFYVLFISIFLGYFVFQFNLGEGEISGGIGYQLNKSLSHLMGWGSILLIVLVLFLWLVFFHGLTQIDDYFLKKSDKEEEGETVNEVTPRVEPTVVEKEVEETLPVVKEPDSLPAKPFDGGIAFSVENFEKEEEPVKKVEEEIALEVAEKENSFLIEDNDDNKDLEEFGPYDPKLDLSSYMYPPISLLADHSGMSGGKVSQEELEANKINIVETMKNFSIGISSIKATIGPTVTLYEIVPEAGVRISKIKNLEDDIALNLAALGIRIIAPMPGKGTIGIEVPNKNREMVSVKSVFGGEKFQNCKYELPIVLGKTIANEIFISDLAKMPHLMMAGATGQGKSVGINVILASLLYKKHPSEVKFVMVDPKKVELSLFNKIERHFLATLPNAEDAIITDTKKVIYTLNSLCIEMDNRYNLLKDAGVRNIREYNAKFTKRKLNPEKGNRYLPYIVLVIDELADLMMTAGKEVEQPIARLAQLARAIGIHLIVATQRPSVNVITGLIKANFPARISFKVTAKVDSRTILDTGGADQLVGNGDMLLSMGSDMVRLQCPFVDTPEIESICDYIGEQRGYESAYMLPEFFGDDEPDILDFDPTQLDVMFDDAARVLVTFQQGSTSLIQRKMKLGYNRAGRIIDQLEGAGIVGPFEGSKAREVLVKDMTHLEEVLRGLKREK
ncbi:FtsK/SpoIIIE family DNA translocase [Arcticibacterium luteifluviistationis]|uniref:Cell division protein FtsK n=1 Tax=Arcticibacterium luteifluviistationis TaxID=1784714 RepID=A0A2Z4GDX2_9BACT|nr:DNA translocase FtsK [Arcticibacterium luteifluviistationis]AWV99446.1 cell division protein FtsK [Arcticibacterium luteifluviistationis]